MEGILDPLNHSQGGLDIIIKSSKDQTLQEELDENIHLTVYLRYLYYILFVISLFLIAGKTLALVPGEGWPTAGQK